MKSHFRASYSTKIALTKILNDLRLSSDINKASILVLLDLTVAFNTVDHCILIDRLKYFPTVILLLYIRQTVSMCKSTSQGGTTLLVG